MRLSFFSFFRFFLSLFLISPEKKDHTYSKNVQGPGTNSAVQMNISLTLANISLRIKRAKKISSLRAIKENQLANFLGNRSKMKSSLITELKHRN